MTGRRAIPPLKALATLECVVRHRSVTQAAEELCVTHGAVSKQLATLAAWVGQPLFSDNRRRMVPTPAALRLAKGIETGLASIHEALDEVRCVAADEPHLHVIAPATLTMYWLIPHLPGLRRAGLRIKAHVKHTHTHEPWEHLPFDVAIRNDREAPAGFERDPIFRDTLGLVASPDLAAEHWPRERLADLPLLESETRPGELDTWLASAGLRRGDVQVLERFEHNYIAIEAALTGQGAVVAPLAVVGVHLMRGTLVQLMPGVVVLGPEYAAVFDPRSAGVRHIRVFARWLKAVAAGDAGAAALAPPRLTAMPVGPGAPISIGQRLVPS